MQKVEQHDTIVNVDEAMTLAENLVKFIAEYRFAALAKKYGKPGLTMAGYVKHVCDDILVNVSR